MSKLDTKKIDSAMRQLENAAKFAVRTLNEMTDNGYKDSSYEKDPLDNLSVICLILRQAKEQAQGQARFAGMEADEIAALQETERAEERETLQQQVQDKLAKRQEKLDAEAAKATEETPNDEGDDDSEKEKRPDPEN